ncbi:hypothetical protein SAMN05421736_101327 [Evansella caseinilytica]|uniref:Rubrerythrin n=1 Tax=Evansella caseinilytica TaxID=1503961 RepID=A0A1H3H1M6_9BACI|nr:hypothetical protein [Evansella caseinilytica]SDY08549.1 hypothetical protein SAMN05421736_101327 [Evansella caseinilytica]
MSRGKNAKAKQSTWQGNQQHDAEPESLQIIRDFVSRESTDELLFDYLKVLAIKEDKNGEAAALLDRMIQEKRGQFRTLKSLYAQLTGRPPEVDAPFFKTPKSLEQGIADIFIRESENIRKFVRLWTQIPPVFAPYIYPMIIQEQTHLTILNYLLLKLQQK